MFCCQECLKDIYETVNLGLKPLGMLLNETPDELRVDATPPSSQSLTQELTSNESPDVLPDSLVLSESLSQANSKMPPPPTDPRINRILVNPGPLSEKRARIEQLLLNNTPIDPKTAREMARALIQIRNNRRGHRSSSSVPKHVSSSSDLNASSTDHSRVVSPLFTPSPPLPAAFAGPRSRRPVDLNDHSNGAAPRRISSNLPSPPTGASGPLPRRPTKTLGG
jgi:hypothetical protein